MGLIVYCVLGGMSGKRDRDDGQWVWCIVLF